MPRKIQFGVYQLDHDAMELRGVLIRLQEQPFRVLATLVDRPGEIITREELRERIWVKDTFVGFDQSLNKAVNRVREGLHNDAGPDSVRSSLWKHENRFF
jgi:DNA-binding response OmpR family regulator